MRRKILTLILCLLVCLCLAPMAHADSEGSEQFAALRQAIANGETFFELYNCGTVVFSESIKIPAKLRLEAFGGTMIVIPNGVMLTIEGECEFSGLTVQPGGHVTINDVNSATLSVHDALSYSSVSQFTVNHHFHVRDRIWNNDLNNLRFGEHGNFAVVSNVENNQALEAATLQQYSFASSKYQHLINIDYLCTLTKDLNIDGFNLHVTSGIHDGQIHCGITVPAGVTLNISKNYKLDMKDGRLILNGSIVNNGECLITREDPALGVVVARGETGSFSGTKPLVIFSENADSCLSGFDLGSFNKEVFPQGIAYIPNGTDSFTELKKAIQNGDSFFDMSNRGTVVFPESITLPSRMDVWSHGTTVILPKGITLTIEDHLNGSRFVLLPGSHVTIGSIGQLSANSALIYDSADQFTINNVLFVTSHSWSDGLRSLRLGPSATVALSIGVHNDNDLAAAIAADYQFPNEQYLKRVNIHYDCTLKEDLDVKGFSLSLDEGSLTIPAGVTLTVYDHLELNGRPLYLQGTIVTHGNFLVKQPDHGEPSSDVLLIRSGDGYCVGKFVVHAEPEVRDACLSGFDLSKFTKYVGLWGTTYYPPIDLILPAGLRRVEAEAFAGGSFRTVYIPEDVTFIDSSAFKDVDPLYIIGEHGTYAEKFAGTHGYVFLVYD